QHRLSADCVPLLHRLDSADCRCAIGPVCSPRAAIAAPTLLIPLEVPPPRLQVFLVSLARDLTFHLQADWLLFAVEMTLSLQSDRLIGRSTLDSTLGSDPLLGLIRPATAHNQ